LTLCGRLPFEKRRSGSMATGGKGVAAQCVALVSAIFAFSVERGLCAPAGGGTVEAAWFPRYTPEDRPQKFDQIVQSWDTANKPSELADSILVRQALFNPVAVKS
jgi:hypothetical protein